MSAPRTGRRRWQARQDRRRCGCCAARQRNLRCRAAPAAAAKLYAIQPRSSENSPISTAPTRVGRMTMRPAASHAARPEPTATATEKTVRNTVITAVGAVDVDVARAASSSDSTSAPTSQNQLTTMAPHHSRGSARSSLMRSQVEARMLRLITRLGAPSPVGGISRLDEPACQRGQQHQPGEMNRIALAVGRDAGDDGAEQNGEERAAFDQRVAAGQFGARQMIGQDAVFDRAEQRAERSEQEQRDEQQDDRMKGKADDGERRGAHLDELDALRHPAPCRSGRQVRRRAPTERRTAR